MDRQTNYAYQVPYETDFLYAERFAYEGMGLLAMDILGSSTLISGLGCIPTTPASLQVQIQPGRMYSKQDLEDTAWGLFNAIGGLPVDANPDHQIIKQGLYRDTTTLATMPAPGTAGQSINYLIEAAFSEVDDTPVSLPFVSSTSPYPPIAPNTLNTVRRNKIVITVKAGVAATTGTQTTPAVDSGNIGLYVVTVANGQSTITAGNISIYAGAPFITETLTQKISQTFADARYLQATNTSNRNRIINGDMRIDQRRSGAAQTFTAGAGIAYCVDRFYASCTGVNITGQQVNGTGAYATDYLFTGAAGNTGTLFGQRIEFRDCGDLINKQVTGQAQIASSTLGSVTWNAYYANAADNFATKTLIATGTLAISSTPTTYSFTFNAGPNAGNGIAIEFVTGALVGGATLRYSAVKLEKGSIATQFIVENMALELEKCQRFYWQPAGSCLFVGAGAVNGAGTRIRGMCPLPVPMRAAPTLTFSGAPSFYAYASAPAQTYSSLVSVDCIVGQPSAVIDVATTGGASGSYDIVGIPQFNAEL